jgi:hypothetical protein
MVAARFALCIMQINWGSLGFRIGIVVAGLIGRVTTITELWFAAHLEHRFKHEKAKLVIQEQITTPQVLHKPPFTQVQSGIFSLN